MLSGGTMKEMKGFTLIELAVVLAIIAVLAAVLTPMVTGYLDQARITRAQADVRTIADGIKLYRNDTGVYPFFDTIAAATSGATANIAGNKSMVAGSNGAAISSQSGVTATTSLELYMNGNVMNRSTTAAPGKARFAGPYVGSVDSDPWGNKYYIQVGNLGSDSTNWAFVVSAGPNGLIDTGTTQARTGAFAAGSDDVVSLIR
jgi:general secretion pathway protein G